MKRIILNRIQCNHCGDIITSYYTHDYKNCKCGKVSIDGGVAYLKRGYTDASDYTELSLNDDQPFEIIRENLHWGTYGKNGDEDLHFVTVNNMNDGHIKAILRTNQGSEWFKSILIKELDYRKDKDIN